MVHRDDNRTLAGTTVCSTTPAVTATMSTYLERLRAQLGEPPANPVGRMLGWELTAVDVGRATYALEVQERHHNQMGVLNGGVLCDLADAAMGSAYATTLKAGESFATVELKINFVRPVRQGRLSATANVIHRGKTLGIAECNVVDESNRLISRASATCITIRGERAVGR